MKRFYWVICLFLLTSVVHYTLAQESQSQLVLNSYSFNAHKRSGFTCNGIYESVERGLTIIHLNGPEKFEFRSFDTYGSTEASQKAMEIIGKLQRNNAVFAILAHDSAAQSLMGLSKEIAKMGLLKLSGLKGRQAYIMHNFAGAVHEEVHDMAIELAIDIPKNITDDQIYFPRIRYTFEPSNDRYIAHAGGEINGIRSTNTKEALDQNYKKGFRLFELDIIKTSDGKYVAAHDWKMWARFTDYRGQLPPSLEEFKKYKIYGDYTTLDLKGVNDWFKAHPDATLVTDKINEPIKFANKFVDKSRLIMELFSVMAIEEASKNGIRAMVSQEPLMGLVGDKLDFMEINNVQYVALSRRIIASQIKLMEKLRDNGIKVYVYNVNFDPGKDEKYVQENEIGLVYGMYADKWVFGK